MAFTEAQIDALSAARASSVRKVNYGDKKVTYNSNLRPVSSMHGGFPEVAIIAARTPPRRVGSAGPMDLI
jgi:hypothetical protein